MDKDELKKKYFDYVNHKLPADLLPGVEQAMKIYKGIYDEFEFDEDEDGPAICIIIDLDESQLAFAAGDGLDVEGPDDETVFHKYKCEMLATCAGWCKETEMNLKQEMGEWLNSLAILADEKGLFEGYKYFSVYGDSDYGAGQYDVLFEGGFDD